MATISEKTRISLTPKSFFAILIIAGSIVSSFWIGVNKVSQKMDIIAAKTDTLKNAIEFQRLNQVNFNDNQQAWNQEQVDFRRRVEFKFGWR